MTRQSLDVYKRQAQRTTRKKVPFGVAQIGKSFRNEITPGNFIFRIREFEQMELEFFCKPDTDLEWFSYWRSYCENWLLNLGIKKEKDVYKRQWTYSRFRRCCWYQLIDALIVLKKPLPLGSGFLHLS